MDEKKIQQFIEWLPTKFKEFQDKTSEEIAQTLNELYKSEEGKQTIETLINTFLEEEKQQTNVFQFGGKINHLVELHKKGKKMSKKCKCGCTMKKVMEKGGIVEKCACGCKQNKISKEQRGGYFGNSLLDHDDTMERAYIRNLVPYKSIEIRVSGSKNPDLESDIIINDVKNAMRESTRRAEKQYAESSGFKRARANNQINSNFRILNDIFKDVNSGLAKAKHQDGGTLNELLPVFRKNILSQISDENVYKQLKNAEDSSVMEYYRNNSNNFDNSFVDDYNKINYLLGNTDNYVRYNRKSDPIIEDIIKSAFGSDWNASEYERRAKMLKYSPGDESIIETTTIHKNPTIKFDKKEEKRSKTRKAMRQAKRIVKKQKE